MERKLASVQNVLSLDSIPGADNIERATVLGWHCVVKKGEFCVGSPCVYCEVDSVLPEKPEFEFLRSRNFRIRTIKLRQQISQGICFPLNVLPCGTYDVGQDVTDELGVKKYELPLPAEIHGQVAGMFPHFIPKTDEIRIQAVPDVLVRHRGALCYYSEKVDGASCTAWVHEGHNGVASRRLEMKELDEDKYWAAAKAARVHEKLAILGKPYVLQGELLGGRVQGNKYHLPGYQILWYNAYDIADRKYLDFTDFTVLLQDLDLPSVPILGQFELNHSVDDMVEMSRGMSKLFDTPREGIVVRPVVETRDEDLGRFSFKAINPDFLLKHGE